MTEKRSLTLIGIVDIRPLRAFFCLLHFVDAGAGHVGDIETRARETESLQSANFGLGLRSRVRLCLRRVDIVFVLSLNTNRRRFAHCSVFGNTLAAYVETKS